MGERSEALTWAGAAIAGATPWRCLDFVNTVEWRHSQRNEFLRDYGDLVRWARHDGVLDDQAAARLLAAGAASPVAAAAVHAAALILREALFALFSADAARAPVPAGSLAVLNAALARAAVPEQVTATAAGWERTYREPRTDLGWVLNPMARSAADLLTSPARDRLKECPGGPTKACGFLFIDETKNRSRRWCSGRTCGNRARLYRHYAGQRGRQPAPGDESPQTA